MGASRQPRCFDFEAANRAPSRGNFDLDDGLFRCAASCPDNSLPSVQHLRLNVAQECLDMICEPA